MEISFTYRVLLSYKVPLVQSSETLKRIRNTLFCLSLKICTTNLKEALEKHGIEFNFFNLAIYLLVWKKIKWLFIYFWSISRFHFIFSDKNFCRHFLMLRFMKNCMFQWRAFYLNLRVVTVEKHLQESPVTD